MKHEIMIVFLVAVAGCVQTANVVSNDVPSGNETNETNKVYANETGSTYVSDVSENKNGTEEQETYTPVPASVKAMPSETPTPARAPVGISVPPTAIPSPPTTAPTRTPTPTATPAITSTPTMTPTPTSTATPTNTPTPTETPSLSHIIFTEVLYDPPGKESEGEWVEIYNPALSSVNLSGWSIGDNSGNWSFPVIALPARSYMRIARDSSGFYNLTGCQPGIDTFTRSLNNDGDQLTLKNSGNEVDFVAWEGGHEGSYEPWNITAAEGNSISRIIIDTDSPADWSVGELSGC